jgi:putative addiction module CopG family antidote
MHISLPPDLEQFVAEQVKSGVFVTPSELVCTGLRLLQDCERLREMRLNELAAQTPEELDSFEQANAIRAEDVFERLKAKIQEGRDALDAGRAHVLDEHTFDRIRAEGERLLADSQRRSS